MQFQRIHFHGIGRFNTMMKIRMISTYGRKDHLPQCIPPPGDDYDEANVDYISICNIQ